MIKYNYLRYGKIFNIPRRIVKHLLSTTYPLVIKIWPLPKVISIEETINKIIKEKLSIARFGDSEFLYIIDKLNLPYQNYNMLLADKLKNILLSNDSKFLVGLPIGYHSLQNLNRESYLTWRSQISWIYPRLRKYLDLNKTYANASISRLYIDYIDRTESKRYFELMKLIWLGREIVIIEGDKSRLGVDNDLFSKAKYIERILAPENNAFEMYNELLAEALKQSKEKLFLIALGPTAKPLAYELWSNGYQAIDIGNLDIEYEWFLRGATEKIKIPGKYTSEAVGGRIVADIANDQYTSEIIYRYIKL